MNRNDMHISDASSSRVVHRIEVYAFSTLGQKCSADGRIASKPSSPTCLGCWIRPFVYFPKPTPKY